MVMAIAIRCVFGDIPAARVEIVLRVWPQPLNHFWMNRAPLAFSCGVAFRITVMCVSLGYDYRKEGQTSMLGWRGEMIRVAVRVSSISLYYRPAASSLLGVCWFIDHRPVNCTCRLALCAAAALCHRRMNSPLADGSSSRLEISVPKNEWTSAKSAGHRRPAGHNSAAAAIKITFGAAARWVLFAQKLFSNPASDSGGRDIQDRKRSAHCSAPLASIVYTHDGW